MKKEKILFLQIYGSGIVGGTEIYLKNLLPELGKELPNLEIYIAVFNKLNSEFSHLTRNIEDSFFTRFLDSWKTLRYQLKWRWWGTFSFIWGLAWLYIVSRRMIEKHQIKVVYANGGHLSALVAYLLHKHLGIKYIVHFHGVFNFAELLLNKEFSWRRLLLSKMTREMLLSAEKIVANSRDVYEDVKRVVDLKDKLVIVHCFVDPEMFRPLNKENSRKALRLPRETFVILSANRLDTGKKIPFLIRAVKMMKQDHLLVLIGDGPLKPEIVSNLNCDQKFRYLEQIKNEELPTYVNAADIVWGVCSVYYMSLTLIEALACGVPIVASKKPSPVDVDWGREVDTGTLPAKVGFLVEESAVKLAKLFDKLSVHLEELRKMQPACIKFYDEVYGKSNIRKIMTVIQEVVE